MLSYVIFKLLSFLSGRLPLRLTYALAVIGGDLYYSMVRKHSGNAVENMRHVLGPTASEKEVRRVARLSFRNYAKYMIDFLRFPYLSRRDIDRLCTTLGWENLEAALQEGKGAIVLSIHFGNWDLGAAMLGGYRVPALALVDTFKPPALDKLIQGTRQKVGLELVPVEVEGALRKIFHMLRRNGMVLIMFDKPQPDGGVPVNFFGGRAWLPNGAAALALKTGAKLIPSYLAREPGGMSFYGELAPALEYELTGDKGKDIQTITQKIVDSAQEIIRRHPDQWYMFRRMWPGEVSTATRPSRSASEPPLS
ncbi:MAG: lysophospholipid acyltransferase family protein [Chloroflexi bacterium]|nr:lysophospholipid acyltransferase family protein [Chloroflexota bacterium]